MFRFLLGTGLRFRSASHLTWANIDFARNFINVAGEQTITRTFRSRKAGKVVTALVQSKSKSRKGRQVPLFPSVKAILLKWREANPTSIYVFGTRSDMPNDHWLEKGKEFWKAVGLNCGVCPSCATKTVYADWAWLGDIRAKKGMK